MEGDNFTKHSTHQCTKLSRRERLYFLARNFQSHHNSTIWKLAFTLPLRILLKPGTLSFKKDTFVTKFVTEIKCLEERKFENYLGNERSGLAFFSPDLGHHLGCNVSNDFGVMLRGKAPQKPEFA